jgi:hypothetical protein
MARDEEPPNGWVGGLLIERASPAAERHRQNGYAGPLIAAEEALKRRNPVYVNLDLAQLGDWNRPVSFSTICEALIEPTVYDTTGAVFFRFGQRRGSWFRAALHNFAGVLIDSRSLDVLVRIIMNSSVEKPIDPWDPSGKFTGILEPGRFPDPHLSKTEALAVLHSTIPFDVG